MNTNTEMTIDFSKIVKDYLEVFNSQFPPSRVKEEDEVYLFVKGWADAEEIPESKIEHISFWLVEFASFSVEFFNILLPVIRKNEELRDLIFTHMQDYAERLFEVPFEDYIDDDAKTVVEGKDEERMEDGEVVEILTHPKGLEKLLPYANEVEKHFTFPEELQKIITKCRKYA
jgi:hypothetical protein